MTLRPLLPRLRPLIETFIPAAARLSPAELGSLLDRVDAALASRPASLRRQLVLFVYALDWLARLRTGKSLAGLDPRARQAFLDQIQDGPLAKFRIGLWGLRTLIFMGYYGDPQIQSQLGYQVNLSGWEANR